MNYSIYSSYIQYIQIWMNLIFRYKSLDIIHVTLIQIIDKARDEARDKVVHLYMILILVAVRNPKFFKAKFS